VFRLELDTELAEVLDKAGTRLEGNGVHADASCAADETFHIIDKNHLLRPELDLFENAAIDPGIGLPGAHFMGRKNFFKMTEQFEVFLYIVKMKFIGI
jgi:hypothetical protein